LVVLIDARKQVWHAYVGDWETYPALRMGCVDEEKRLSCVSRCSLSLGNNRHGIKMMVFNCFIF